MKVRDRLATDRTQPVVAVFCVVGIACAVFAVVARSRAQTPHRVVTVSVANAPRHIVAADDCPASETCIQTGVRAAVVASVLAAFPGTPTNDLAHAALAGTKVRPGANVHRETVDLRTSDGVLVTVVSRCVDQGSGVSPSQSSIVPANGPATVFAVVPGRPGCSVAVILRVPAGVVVPWKQAVTLAHRPELQLAD